MAKDDWAVVVGINTYPDPDIGHLNGPETDAARFYDWVTTSQGVPTVSPEDHGRRLATGLKQAKLILSSHFGPPAQNAIDGMPTVDAVYSVFDQLDDISQENQKQGNGFRIGRRLYLYLAGHGFEPVVEEVVLLMANARRRRPNYHIPGRVIANQFYRARQFDEVVLFMDCCRESYPAARLMVPPFIDTTGQDAPEAGRRFYGYATKWSRKSRERVFDGVTRGVFSAALLDALEGAASEPDGRVTANSLGSWLYNNMKTYLEPADLLNPDIPKEPDLFWDKGAEGDNFVIATTTPKTYLVHMHFPTGWIGQSVRVLTGKQFQEVASTTITAASWSIPLPIGTYLAVISNGQTPVIEVNGKGDVDANF